ncbi:unnamed protein product [Gemmata massiliana]|uniref:Uncharacterized protein n=1 Tax=Gemmata massiliana TaxID=1210884 RepID=A0A6P2D7E9_9BACT|nr:unnamed protein product [Gemmata massiliana]
MLTDETSLARLAILSCAVLLVTVGIVTGVLSFLDHQVVIVEP